MTCPTGWAPRRRGRVRGRGVGWRPSGADRSRSSGSGSGGNDNAQNQFTIDTLNSQLVGPTGILTMLPSTNPMAVFANYFMGGAIWTKGGMNSTDANQRGSLELANTTMETFVQSAPPAANLNCFDCHNFDTANPKAVSHIFQATSSKVVEMMRQAAERQAVEGKQ